MKLQLQWGNGCFVLPKRREVSETISYVAFNLCMVDDVLPPSNYIFNAASTVPAAFSEGMASCGFRVIRF